MLNVTPTQSTLKLICSACSEPFMAKGDQYCSLPLCGCCQAKANRLMATVITGLSSHEQRELARSVVQLGHKLRRVGHA